jgi:hypothetical protein
MEGPTAEAFRTYWSRSGDRENQAYKPRDQVRNGMFFTKWRFLSRTFPDAVRANSVILSPAW